MAVYWGKDFGIRVVVLGALFVVAGLVLSAVCSKTVVQVSPPGPAQCVEYGFGGWDLGILLSGIGLIVLGLVSVLAGREPPGEDEPLLE
jgi:hypothetical protein